MMILPLYNKFYSWLLPYTCILCHFPAKRPQDLCQPCFDKFPILPQADQYCLKNLPAQVKGYALFAYETPITRLIKDLKFHEKIRYARLLGEWMAAAVPNWYFPQPLPTRIIPVPLHPLRLKERGFNQALEIARPVARALNLPIDTHSCRRIKPTIAQTQLSAFERQKNVKNAFAITGDLSGVHIAVIEDVVTTGHTLTELCKTLISAGVAQVDAWCCARA